MKLTVIHGNGTIFSSGDEFKLYGVDYNCICIIDDDGTEYPLSDLIDDGVEFKITHD